MTVAIVATHVECFNAQVSAGVPKTISFNGGGADFIAVVVCWESYTDPAPAVIYNGQVAQVVVRPQMNVGSPGAIALYAIDVDSPDMSAHDLVVQPTPNYAGWTSIFVASYSGSSKHFGQMETDQYGTHDAGVSGGTTSVEECLAGSVVAYAGFTTFGAHPTGLTIDDGGGTEIGRDDGTNLTAFAAELPIDGFGNAFITVSDPVEFFNFHVFAYEVTPSGTPVDVADVVVTASHTERLDRPGADTATCSFDVNGGDVLIVVLMRSNSSGDTVTDAVVGPSTYGDRELIFLPQFHERNVTISAQFSTAILMNPPDGTQTFSTEGFTGNVGYVNVLLVALSGDSGVIGVRHVSSQQGNAFDCQLDDTSVVGSLMLAVQVASHTYNEMTSSYGWEQIDYVNEPGTNGEDPPTQLAAWVFTAVGGLGGFNLILTPAAFSSTLTLVMEWRADLGVAADVEGAGAVLEDRVGQQGTGEFDLTVAPSGQEFHAYHEIWRDWPSKPPELMQPDDFYLANLPPYLGAVVLFSAKVQATYVDLSSDIIDTMGLQWPGSALLMQQTIALLKERNPTIKVFLGIQQYNFTYPYNTPYDPGGWGGLTSDHLSAHEAFCNDMGIEGIVLDYEVSAPNDPPWDDLIYHCYTVDGERFCYTDDETVDVVKAFRNHFPRPFLLGFNAAHVGAYGQDEYTFAPPGLGYNSGITMCIARDAEALAALDFFHCMTYDAGGGYDPRQAMRAFQHYFPSLELFMGIRVGPADFEDVKITGYQFRDFANTCMKLGLAGGHMYSTMWDVTSYGYPDGDPPPYGDYNWDFPDGNVAGGIFAERFQLSYGPRPRLNNRKQPRGGVVAPA